MARRRSLNALPGTATIYVSAICEEVNLVLNYLAEVYSSPPTCLIPRP